MTKSIAQKIKIDDATDLFIDQESRLLKLSTGQTALRAMTDTASYELTLDGRERRLQPQKLIADPERGVMIEGQLLGAPLSVEAPQPHKTQPVRRFEFNDGAVLEFRWVRGLPRLCWQPTTAARPAPAPQSSPARFSI